MNLRTLLGIETGVDATARSLDSTNITPGESLSFMFDQAVKITSLNFQAGNGDEVEVSSDAFDDFSAVVSLGTISLPDVIVPANTKVVFTGGDGSPSGTVSDYQFSGTSFSIVPEPASLSLVALGGLMMLSRRRKA